MSTSEVALQTNVERMVKQQNVRLLGKTVKKERDSKPWGGALQVKVTVIFEIACGAHTLVKMSI